ncbi:hypothetical protein [Dyadobacter sp. BHUBP1]|uniref:hypothetical protein n=1 Tax=Dyadobacter sp. BHUBP1 TaxID=3424178 RepID=UPI003D34AF0F
MSNFISNTVDFGTVKERANVSVAFVKTPECKAIQTIVGSCGCAIPKDTSDRITTTFFAGEIARQILENGGQTMPVQKSFTVYYKDKTSEVLFLKGIITR